MNILNLLTTYPGMYVTQSFLHALVASVITAGAVWTWKIQDPVVKQRFRFALILIPIFSFPAYQLINPQRSSAFFRLEALFDSSRWLNMELWGAIPLYLAFFSLLLITSMIFFLQEMIPVVRHTIESRQMTIEGDVPSDDSPVGRALRSLPMERPPVVIIEDDELVLFSTTGENASIVISTGLVNVLDEEQIRAALAHEAAHIARNRKPVLLVVFFLRMLMFFNPVVLVEFRRAVRNEEKICDDIAVSVTRQPRVLAETLKKFYPARGPAGADAEKHPLSSTEALEEYSHNLQLGSRIARLEQGLTRAPRSEWFPFALVLLITAVINYFVV